MTYRAVYEFTDRGLVAYRRMFEGQLDEDAIVPTDAQFATPVPGTKAFSTAPAASAKELAQRILDALGQDWSGLLSRAGVWAWLTFVLRDRIFPKQGGVRKPGELHRWYPSDPGDWQKAQRHLVRMPVVLLGNLGSAADHLLCGSPGKLPEIREQLTSQQDMFSAEFQKAARALYYDETTQGLKRGSGGKGAGSPRRLAKVRQQLDVTWDLFDLDAARIVQLLPKEFERFRPSQS